MIYCPSCDIIILHKSINKHNKTKSHIYFRNNYVIKKYYIGDVFWNNFENVIKDYINDYNNKFKHFSIKIDFQLNNNEYNIAIDNIEGRIPLYKFDNNEWIYYKFCQSRKVIDYIIYNASLRDIILDSSTIINKVSLTIFLKYTSMKRYHLLQQPRLILESKILKQIHNKDFTEKLTKYYFISRKYDLLNV